jgi:hypothetical protein
MTDAENSMTKVPSRQTAHFVVFKLASSKWLALLLMAQATP